MEECQNSSSRETRQQRTDKETTMPPISAIAESGGIPRRWDTFSDAPESRRKTAAPSNLARVNRRPLACRGMTLFRFPNDMLDTTFVLFCACGARMTAAVVLIGAICPLPSRGFALDPWDDLDTEIVGIWKP